MKRGLIVLVVVLAFLASESAWAQRAGGLRLGLEFGNPNAVLIVRPGPMDFRVGYNFAQAGYLFLSADYRLLSGYQLVDVLCFFIGVGAYAEVFFEPAAFSMGARVPLGLQLFLFKNVLELFLEVAPTVGFMPGITAFPEWQGYLGFTLLIPR